MPHNDPLAEFVRATAAKFRGAAQVRSVRGTNVGLGHLSAFGKYSSDDQSLDETGLRSDYPLERLQRESVHPRADLIRRTSRSILSDRRGR